MWKDYGQLCLKIGKYDAEPYNGWENNTETVYFKNETQLLKALDELLQLKYSGDHNKDLKAIQGVIRPFIYGYCDERGYSVLV